jgi:chemotaxis signal transduction protein
VTAVSVEHDESRFRPGPVPPPLPEQSRFVAAPPDGQPRSGPGSPVDAPRERGERHASVDPDGYVVFAAGETTFAVAVSEVHEVIRAARLELLVGAPSYGRRLALVDVRGRSIPVVDLRESDDAPGDVLLPVFRHSVGLVVDRVLAVRTPRELVPEHDEVPDALPFYARGLLRPVEGGAPVVLIALPDAAELEAERATLTRSA